MSDLFGNHIVGFPTRRLVCYYSQFLCLLMTHAHSTFIVGELFGLGLCIKYESYLVLFIKRISKN